MKTKLFSSVNFLCMFLGTSLIFGVRSMPAQDTTVPAPQAVTPAPQAATPTPQATFPATPPARGRGNRPQATASDLAEIAKLADLPPYSPGVGDGDYSIGPEYAPAPEQTAKDGVPKGKVESFKLNAADSKFYPDTGLRGAHPRAK